jgi:hypothetical protein
VKALVGTVQVWRKTAEYARTKTMNRQATPSKTIKFETWIANDGVASTWDKYTVVGPAGEKIQSEGSEFGMLEG